MFKALARSAAFGAGIAAAGVVALVSLAFALYYLLRDPLTSAGAAAVTGVVFLVIAGVLAAMMRGAKHEDHHAHAGHAGHAGHGGSGVSGLLSGGGGQAAQRAITFAKQRPLVAGGVGLVGALYLLRNPALLSGLIGLAAGRAEGKQEARRGFF